MHKQVEEKIRKLSRDPSVMQSWETYFAAIRLVGKDQLDEFEGVMQIRRRLGVSQITAPEVGPMGRDENEIVSYIESGMKIEDEPINSKET